MVGEGCRTSFRIAGCKQMCLYARRRGQLSVVCKDVGGCLCGTDVDSAAFRTDIEVGASGSAGAAKTDRLRPPSGVWSASSLTHQSSQS